MTVSCFMAGLLCSLQSMVQDIADVYLLEIVQQRYWALISLLCACNKKKYPESKRKLLAAVVVERRTKAAPVDGLHLNPSLSSDVIRFVDHVKLFRVVT